MASVKSGIYQIKNLINEKIYVGSTKSFKRRFAEHKRNLKDNNHYNLHLQNAWNKYGEENFEFTIIESVDDLSKIKEHEQFWINETKCYNHEVGYNMQRHTLDYSKINFKKGSTHHWLGKKHSKQTLKKMSESKRGNKHNLYGTKRSKESNMKTSLSMKGKKSGEKHHNSKLTEREVRQIKLILLNLDRLNIKKVEIARFYNIKPPALRKIETGERWSHIKIDQKENVIMSNLEMTKGKIKLVGKVVGIGNENSVREGFTKADVPYKSLSFFVQTSEINRVKVELFGMVREHVYAYSQKEKKSQKIAWDKRHDNHGSYKVIGVNAFLEDGADGKKARKVLVEYDVIDYIQEHLKDGDVVRVTGAPDFQQFEVEGEMKESTKFNFNSITKLDEELDFEAEDFKEVATFEQDIVVTDTMVDKESKKLIINANIIKYGDDVVSTSFVVDGEKYPKLAKNMAKRLGFGDFIKVYGRIINATILEEVEASDVVDDDDDWGGDTDIASEFENNFIKTYITEMQVISVDSSSYEKKKYKEEDFMSEDEDAFNGDLDEENEEDDPFSDSEGEDDLPFE